MFKGLPATTADTSAIRISGASSNGGKHVTLAVPGFRGQHMSATIPPTVDRSICRYFNGQPGPTLTQTVLDELHANSTTAIFFNIKLQLIDRS